LQPPEDKGAGECLKRILAPEDYCFYLQVKRKVWQAHGKYGGNSCNNKDGATVPLLIGEHPVLG